MYKYSMNKTKKKYMKKSKKSKKVKKGGCCIISTLFGVKSSKGKGKGKGKGKDNFNTSTNSSSRLPNDLQQDFTIQTNRGNGDCFFLSLSQGLATVGVKYSVADLRQIVLDNISFKTYNTNMWEYYISKEIIGTGVTAYFNKMYTPFTQRQTDLINQIKATNNNNDVIHLTNQLIVESTNTSNERQFKIFILSNNYWADISAIEILGFDFINI